MITELSIAFIIYALTLVSIGWYSYSRTQSSADFMLGGRRINYLVTAISAHASDMSTWLFFGLPAAIYINGIHECWAAIGLLIGMWATWHFIAPQLRARTEQTKSMTIPHFFARVTHDPSEQVLLISASASLFFFLFYVASGLKGIGILLHALFALPYAAGIMLGVSVVVIYTMLGGYVAVALTDFFQGLFLLSMITVVPFVIFYNLPVETTPLFWASLKTGLLPDWQSATIISALVTAVSWGLGYCGMPHVLTKFMSIDTVKNIKKAKYIGLTWQFIALGSAITIGLLSKLYFTAPLQNAEHLFIVVVLRLFTPLIAGFILCAILAATISTIDSQVIVCATVITRDLLHIRNSYTQLRVSRYSILLLTCTAALIASYSTQTLYEIVRYAWAGLGSTFGPAVIGCLFLKRITPMGIVSGMLTGAFMAALWPVYAPILTHAAMIPAFLSSFLVLLIVSRYTRHTAPIEH